MITVIPRIEYTDTRDADSSGVNKLGAYCLIHLKAAADINDYLRVSVGVNNISGKLYEINENYPLAGRVYTLSVTAKY